ncbi:MAG: helix-turn-helix domain-containing protein [Methanocorpusculum sp.]|uniref:TrmB family transcriptional regulator n=1 Tax=Methanocorpusculum sp. TaxID=2058474 RepID=UPI002B206B18|nr:helix-turn-helix domain-containing protein [Methanocorpusculum sp.]MEA5086411.1 helix-turn-helix domain-containing protein [Methanocorpusculum sp.]
MFEDNMIAQLKGIGLSEYEAKIYLILACIHSASPRELHETTLIPRGRVYETLGSLEKKGFIISNRRSPVRYRTADIPYTMERLKKEAVIRYDMLGMALETYAALACPDQPGQTYNIRTGWGVENHIRYLLRTAKNELLIISDDPVFYHLYAEDIARAEKRIRVSCIVSSRKTANSIPFQCYFADEDTKDSLFSPPLLRKLSMPVKEVIYADRKEVLSVYEREGKEEAAFTKNSIYAEFITRVVLKNTMMISP